MIKFEIKNKETGKKEQYTKDIITMGEAEKFYEFMEKRAEEVKKEKADMRKIREMERQFFVSLFSEQGLTEEDVLNHMGTRQYSDAIEDVFREIAGEDEEDTEDEEVQEGKNEE